MPPKSRRVLRTVADNVFWVFLGTMIILGSVLETPLVNVGLTAR